MRYKKTKYFSAAAFFLIANIHALQPSGFIKKGIAHDFSSFADDTYEKLKEKDLSSVQSLVLHDNSMCEDHICTVLTKCDPDRLVKLDLRAWGCFGVRLPEILAKFVNLRELRLEKSGCALNELPTWLENLSKLKIITIPGGRFVEKEPPFWISNLKELQFADFSARGMTKLPEWIGELKDLKELNLKSNYLERLPEEICKLENLEILDLAWNQLLENLPAKMSRLEKLKKLNISYTGLKEIPGWVNRFKTEVEFKKL